MESVYNLKNLILYVLSSCLHLIFQNFEIFNHEMFDKIIVEFIKNRKL